MSHVLRCDWCGKVLKWEHHIHVTRKPHGWMIINDGRHMCDECTPDPGTPAIEEGSEQENPV